MIRTALVVARLVVVAVPLAALVACRPAPAAGPASPGDPVAAAPAAAPAPAALAAGSATPTPGEPTDGGTAAEPAPTPLAPLALVDGVVAVPTPIEFLGPDQPAFASEPVLQAVVQFLADHTEVTLLRIEVHTDARGSGRANQAVSERRARAVADWLVEHGASCQRLLPVGFGESKPIADNATAEGRARNRRVVLAAATLDDRAVGGSADGGGTVAGDPCHPTAAGLAHPD